jgi:hypothetical protein
MGEEGPLKVQEFPLDILESFTGDQAICEKAGAHDEGQRDEGVPELKTPAKGMERDLHEIK